CRGGGSRDVGNQSGRPHGRRSHPQARQGPRQRRHRGAAAAARHPRLRQGHPAAGGGGVPPGASARGAGACGVGGPRRRDGRGAPAVSFPDAFVEEVRRTADIARYISEHVQLRKMGASYKGLCPFQQEKTPSFNVNPDRGAFHCFGCGVGGDVFKFAMLHDKVSFPEAIELVARRFGIPVPENRYEQGPDRKERDEMLALLDAATEHFERNLWNAPGARAREYLLGRGFKKDTLERIRAGAAADSWGDLFEALKRRFPVAALMTAGLVREGQKSNKPYDWFRNRAVFPILNDAGRIVGFGARSLDGSEPKYLNSPESPLYQKSRTLYGLSWAKDAIRREGRVVLMEGYLDVARALECGVQEVVATCGTALTAAHARLIRRFS